jgi:hypothetical protein
MLIRTEEAQTMLPTEPFWDAIATEQMEERLEFAEWETSGSIEASTTCGATGCETEIRASVEVSGW